jgi:hypothetical protein
VAFVATSTYNPYRTITTRRGKMRPAIYVLLGVLLVPTVGLVGDIVTDGRLKSTMSAGAPLEVASSDMVTNLNADMVDGVEGTDLYTQAEVDTMLAAAVESARPRSFYLTDSVHNGADADDACEVGFHMASLWEVSDPSNVRYASHVADAFDVGDLGGGPPTAYTGWIRTGYWVEFDVTAPGRTHCLLWGSSAGSYRGTVARLPRTWSAPDEGGWSPVWGTAWAASSETCDTEVRVWCIED